MYCLLFGKAFCDGASFNLDVKRNVFLSLRAIINHFNPKIESYAAVNHISQLSEEQVNTLFLLLHTHTEVQVLKMSFSQNLGAIWAGLHWNATLVFPEVNLMNFLMQKGKHWVLCSFCEGAISFYLERMPIHQEAVTAARQRLMAQTSVIVMRHLEEQLISQITELGAHHGWCIAYSSAGGKTLFTTNISSTLHRTQQ